MREEELARLLEVDVAATVTEACCLYIMLCGVAFEVEVACVEQSQETVPFAMVTHDVLAVELTAALI